MTKIERKNGLTFSIKGGKDVDIYNVFHAALISCKAQICRCMGVPYIL